MTLEDDCKLDNHNCINIQFPSTLYIGYVGEYLCSSELHAESGVQRDEMVQIKKTQRGSKKHKYSKG